MIPSSNNSRTPAAQDVILTIEEQQQQPQEAGLFTIQGLSNTSASIGSFVGGVIGGALAGVAISSYNAYCALTEHTHLDFYYPDHATPPDTATVMTNIASGTAVGALLGGAVGLGVGRVLTAFINYARTDEGDAAPERHPGPEPSSALSPQQALRQRRLRNNMHQHLQQEEERSTGRDAERPDQTGEPSQSLAIPAIQFAKKDK